ncbi:MAG: Nif3-like dinuclear metal center hexameric protein [Oscillospiraceae bacterium]|jgi:dinuclear metal center YbgI/SA1388 family protein|nr:Nif3-like dinuclear metal center hexameric protein [Oscillospiraceae bacterium]
MVTLKDIFNYMCELAPMEGALPWDNPGLLAGHTCNEIKRVIVALDITDEVIEECVSYGGELIISHHPVIFKAVSSVTDSTVTGRRLLKLIENKIGAVCMHTNLDVAAGGVNDLLARRLELDGVSVCPGTEEVIRMGFVAETEVGEFAERVKSKLGCNGVRLYKSGDTVSKIAVGGGACGRSEYITWVKRCGCDILVTSDLDYAEILEAQEIGLGLIDAGHFATEDVICPAIAEAVGARFPSVLVKKSEALRDTAIFI